MSTVAWQPADGVLQVLLVGKRPAAASAFADGAVRAGRFARTACATPDDAAAHLSARPWDCVVADAEAVPDLRRFHADVPVVALGTAEPIPGADDQVRENGDAEVLARVVRHVVERRRTQAALAQSALHDPLTGLPNRVLLADRIVNAFSRLPRSGRKLAVLCLALDGFKLVNDSLGHAAGDALLVQVAERLRGVMRPSDTVARLGGDAFAVLCDEMDPAADPEPIARRVLAALATPFRLQGGEHHMAASVGITEAGAGGDAAGVLRQADAAMTAAKRSGGGCARYEHAMGDRAMRRLTLHNELHGALERSELVLHYQPQVQLCGGAPTGVEALVRWEHTERGLVSPADFIPVAEDSGLIVPIGRWVLREACEQLARWTEEGGPMAALTMGVNLSARQLADPGLVEDVAIVLAETGVEPQRVCLEITETAVLDDVALADQRLSALKALGVQLAIDDFGTGYSSLGQLGRFPVDVLKIDRSFVKAMGEEGEHERGRGVVAAVITLARAMGLEPVAEGVETEGQAEVLRALGCPSAQGFLFSPARPAGDVERLLRTEPPSRPPLRAVVCDDVPALRDLVRRSLELDGRVEVVGEAEDGQEAVALVDRLRPDVVVLDLEMPGVDGLTALPDIRRLAPDVQVIVLSACDAGEAEERVLALGALRYVEKPAGPATLLAAVHETVAA